MPEDVDIEEDDRFSWQEIQNRLDESQRLIDSGAATAAYLILWIAFERMMRYQARKIALPIERLAPSILTRQLYSQGELSMEQFDIALECQAVRNRLIHGFSVPRLDEAVTKLNIMAHQLVDEWSTP